MLVTKSVLNRLNHFAKNYVNTQRYFAKVQMDARFENDPRWADATAKLEAARRAVIELRELLEEEALAAKLRAVSI